MRLKQKKNHDTQESLPVINDITSSFEMRAIVHFMEIDFKYRGKIATVEDVRFIR
jgi:hypothetical protein